MAKYLVLRGHHVTLLVTADSRKVGIKVSNWDGVRIIEAPDLLWGQLRSGLDLWDLINRIIYLSQDQGPYDLMHCFETRPTTIYPALYYRNRHKLLFITDWNDWWGRGGIINEFRPFWIRFLFGGIETYYEEAFRANADGLTVISTALVKRASDLGVPSDKICHIPGGALSDKFIYRSTEECRNRFGFPLPVPIIGYSSLNQHVEVEFMMQTLSIIARKFPAVKLLVTGKTAKAVRALSSKYQVEKNILLTGLVPYEELPWYLGCADVFVLPFPNKPYNIGRWPNKIGDYISLGRPIVSNPVGDVKRLLEENPIGLLAEWDPTDFAEKIIFLFENQDMALNLGKNARQLAISQYDWKVLAARLETFYFMLMDKAS
jgi:glycosyltransferase involved in cell wall biosynthesis